MPRQFRPISPNDNWRQSRDYDAWMTQYIHDTSWVEYISADKMLTDGPRVFRGIRNSTIVLSAITERNLSATLRKQFFWLNGKARVFFYFYPSSANPGDLEIKLEIYSHKLDDTGEAGTLLETQTSAHTITSEGLQELVFQMDQVRFQADDVFLGFTFTHTPTNPANTYPDKVYVPGCRLEYQTLVRQQ